MASVLLPGEARLWQNMRAADRRHSVAVARQVQTTLPAAERAVVAAALLHDVGKIESGFGTFARVAATLIGASPLRTRVGGRVAAYLHHPEIGAAMLEAAGSEPLTTAWAREHHLPSAEWTVPRAVGAALKAADDD